MALGGKVDVMVEETVWEGVVVVEELREMGREKEE